MVTNSRSSICSMRATYAHVMKTVVEIKRSGRRHYCL